jgi:hypothetical protein
LIWAISTIGAGLDVEWSAPVDCPGPSAVEEAVHARLDDAFATTPASVRGRIRGKPGAWTLDLEVRTATAIDTRRVDDPDCATLGDAAALIIAVTIERAVESGAAREPLLRSIAPTMPMAMQWIEPTRELPSAPPRDTTEPARRPSEIRLGARAAAGVEVGALPGVGADIEVAALLQRRRFIAELAARYEPPRPARYPDAPDAGGDLSLWAVGAAGCFAPATGRVQFPLCAGAEAGGIHGRGVGLPRPERDHLPWAAAKAGAGVSVAVLPWLRVTADAGVLVPLWRPRFSTDSRGPVHQAAPAAGRFHLGLEFIRP